jgi:hypothetical protein
VRTPTRRVVGAMVAALLLSGCAGDDEHPGDGPVADRPVEDSVDDGGVASPPPPPATGDGETPDALAFSARTLDGGTLDAADLAGQHVALWMWAPW